MGFDLQRAAVVTGDGIVARFPGVLCVAWCTEREPLQHLLQLCADVAGPEPGRALARRLVTWLAGPEAPGDGLVFGTVAAAGEQIAVFLSGTAGVEVAGTGITVSGADSASWTDRLLQRPETAVVLALDGTSSSGTTDVNLFDLRSGVVPGAGVVLLPGADPGQGPGSARGGDPGWSAPEPVADQGSGGYQAPGGGYSGRPAPPVPAGGALGGRSERSHRASAGGSEDSGSYDTSSYRRDPSLPSRRSRRVSASARHWAVEEEPEAAVAEIAAASALGVPVARTASSGAAMSPVVPAPATPPRPMPVVPDHVEPPTPEYAAPEYAAAEYTAPEHGTEYSAEYSAEYSSEYSSEYSTEYAADEAEPAISNGHTNGHSNGHRSNGYAENGSYQDNGSYPENGYTENGNTENGYANDAPVEAAAPENGYVENGYQENGYQENRYAESAAVPVIEVPELPPADENAEDFSAGEWFGGTEGGEGGEAAQQQPTDMLAVDADDPESGMWTEPGEVVTPAPEPAADHEPATDEQQQYDETTDQPVREAVAAAEQQAPEVADDGDVPVQQVQAAQIMGVEPGEPPRPPLASGATAPQNATNGSAGATTEEQQAQGHLCARGHLNDPRSHFCVLCGIRMNERTGVLVTGTRPPLGLIVFDDGATYTVDAEYLVGRMPEADPRVRSGALRSIVIEDHTGAVSRVHAEIRVSGWDVLLSDSGSRNGTFVAGASETGWTPLAPGRGRRLVPGTRVRIGGRSFVFESPSGVR